MATPPYTITNESVTVVLSGKTYTVKRGDENFTKARDAVLNERWDEVPSLVSKGLGIAKWAKGAFTFVDNFMCYKGERLPIELNQRMINMALAGDDPTFLMRFWERLQLNPSWRSVQQLYPFLMHKGIAIDQDGFLLMYKSVTKDYKDFYSKTFDNRPGVTNKMSRNKISDDYDTPCHTGFHAGNLNYASTFGSGDRKIIIVKVDPMNVVSVCKIESEKVRVCEYSVLGNYGGTPLPSTTYDSTEEEENLQLDPYVEDDAEEDEEQEQAEEDEERAEEDEDLPLEGDVKLGSAWSALAKGEPVPVTTEVVQRKVAWEGFDKMSDEELSKQSVEDLRKYAGQRLKIVGASKHRKDGLLAVIFPLRVKA